MGDQEDTATGPAAEHQYAVVGTPHAVPGLTLHPDESAQVEKDDGSSVTVTANTDGGKEVTTILSDGSMTDVVQHADGSKEQTTLDSDGTVHHAVQHLDGSKETSEFDAAGQETAAGHTDPAGHSFNDHATESTHSDSGPAHHPEHNSEHHSEQHAGHGAQDHQGTAGGTTVTTADGSTSMVATASDGSWTSETIGADGSVTRASMEPGGSGQVTHQGSDGSTVGLETSADGSQVGATASDGHGGGFSIALPAHTDSDGKAAADPGQPGGPADTNSGISPGISTTLNPADGDGHPGDGATSSPVESHSHEPAAHAGSHQATAPDHHDDYIH